MEIAGIDLQKEFDSLCKKLNQTTSIQSALVAIAAVGSIFMMIYLFTNLIFFEMAVAVLLLAGYGVYHIYHQHIATSNLFQHARNALKELI